MSSTQTRPMVQLLPWSVSTWPLNASNTRWQMAVHVVVGQKPAPYFAVSTWQGNRNAFDSMFTYASSGGSMGPNVWIWCSVKNGVYFGILCRRSQNFATFHFPWLPLQVLKCPGTAKRSHLQCLHVSVPYMVHVCRLTNTCASWDPQMTHV